MFMASQHAGQRQNLVNLDVSHYKACPLAEYISTVIWIVQLTIQLPTFAQNEPARQKHRDHENLFPDLRVLCRFCEQFPCTALSQFLQSLTFVSCCLGSSVFMGASAATSSVVNVLIADSNRMQVHLLAGALRRRPEFRVTTCAMDAPSIIQAVTPRVPHVALLCLNSPADMPETILTIRSFHLVRPGVPKVVVASSSDRELVVSAFRSGARGIFSITDSDMRLLCKCVLRVAAGQIWASTEQLNHLVDLISEVPSLRVINSGGHPLLTPREEQVVALVAEGMGNRQIARELNLSEHTIKKYLFRIFEKLGVSSRVELVLYAVNNGDPRSIDWSHAGGRKRSA
jgi:DNA-binding NarL/FixJ family response regulator